MANIPNTYNSLFAAVQEMAEDDSTEFANYIPTAIFLAEERLIREVDTNGVNSIVVKTGTAGVALVDKPDGYQAGHYVTFSVLNGVIKFMTKKERSFLLDYWPNLTLTGTPKYYADEDDTKVRIAPVPDQQYFFGFAIVGQPPHLSATVASNYFSTKCADALFFGTMVEMMAFAKNETDMAMWEGRYKQAIDSIDNKGRRERRDDAVANNPKSAVNTVKGAGN